MSKPKAFMSPHCTGDWCHVCGHRVEHLVDIWYPRNAEHDRPVGSRPWTNANAVYVRICVACIDAARREAERHRGVA